MIALETSRKRWSAAAINTRLLEARKTGESSDLETENAQTLFTEAAKKLTQQAESLAHSRSRRDQFFALAKSPTWSADATAEHQATLDLLDALVSDEFRTYQILESELQKTAQSVDPPAKLAWQKKSEAQSLHQEYRKALE